LFVAHSVPNYTRRRRLGGFVRVTVVYHPYDKAVTIFHWSLDAQMRWRPAVQHSLINQERVGLNFRAVALSLIY
jgi:hypothetical protein